MVGTHATTCFILVVLEAILIDIRGLRGIIATAALMTFFSLVVRFFVLEPGIVLCSKSRQRRFQVSVAVMVGFALTIALLLWEMVGVAASQETLSPTVAFYYLMSGVLVGAFGAHLHLLDTGEIASPL